MVITKKSKTPERKKAKRTVDDEDEEDEEDKEEEEPAVIDTSPGKQTVQLGSQSTRAVSPYLFPMSVAVLGEPGAALAAGNAVRSKLIKEIEQEYRVYINDERPWHTWSAAEKAAQQKLLRNSYSQHFRHWQPVIRDLMHKLLLHHRDADSLPSSILHLLLLK